MKTNLLALAGSLILLAGCQTPNLPRHAKAVGGGLDIEWTALSPGTVMVVETHSGRAVLTRSVEEGDTFSFDGQSGKDVNLVLTMFGQVDPAHDEVQLPKDTRFVLFFIPTEPAE